MLALYLREFCFSLFKLRYFPASGCQCPYYQPNFSLPVCISIGELTIKWSNSWRIMRTKHFYSVKWGELFHSLHTPKNEHTCVSIRYCQNTSSLAKSVIIFPTVNCQGLSNASPMQTGVVAHWQSARLTRGRSGVRFVAGSNQRL